MDNNELYIKILDQFPNPIWRAGLDTKCDFFNKNWLEFTGRTMEQEVGNGWVEGVHPDDLKSCVDEYLANFKEKKAFKLKYRLKHNDGTYHWLLDFGSPFFDENNNFLGYIGSCYDINKEESQKENETNFRLLFENMIEGVAIHEMIYDKDNNPIDYKIVNINKSYEKYTGIAFEKAVGALATSLYNTKTPPYIEEYNSVIKNNKPFFFETYFEPMKKWFFISVFSPKPDYFVTIFEDTTDRKTNEEKIKNSNIALQSKVEELDKFNKLMVGRELSMVELKQKNAELEKELLTKK